MRKCLRFTLLDQEFKFKSDIVMKNKMLNILKFWDTDGLFHHLMKDVVFVTTKKPKYRKIQVLPLGTAKTVKQEIIADPLASKVRLV